MNSNRFYFYFCFFFTFFHKKIFIDSLSSTLILFNLIPSLLMLRFSFFQLHMIPLFYYFHNIFFSSINSSQEQEASTHWTQWMVGRDCQTVREFLMIQIWLHHLYRLLYQLIMKCKLSYRRLLMKLWIRHSDSGKLYELYLYSTTFSYSAVLLFDHSLHN